MKAQKKPEKTIKWGIIGPGKIAHKFAGDLSYVSNTELYAVASRDQSRAEAFAKQYKVPFAYRSYWALAEDPEIDAVYVATPHSLHKENSLMCLKQKKAVLCEKPLAINSTEVEEIIAVAKSEKILLMEALWTAFLPGFQSAVQKLKDGTIGKIISIEASFGFQPPYQAESRLFNKQLGGGSLLDIGIYPLFLALSLLGKPSDIDAKATFFDTGVDSSCKINLLYENSVKAKLFSTFLREIPVEAFIQGSEGSLKIHHPFHEAPSFSIKKKGKTEQFNFANEGGGFVYEIAHFCELLRQEKTESPVMSFEVSSHLIGLMDEVGKKIAFTK
ncbi:MAG: gfo/Idh/MocA family oxidoreductase [Saprospirales bacterium]|nr:MAG: gfo/Idh/MocA family oxidoreductase [Saprospirales bacterium]